MSIEILLVPAAIAAAAAFSKRDGDRYGQRFVTVGTRMADVRLLSQALGDTGASVTSDDLELIVEWDELAARFSQNAEGLWSAHFDGTADQATAESLIADVDAAYGLRVQSEVLRRVRAQADQAGLRLEDERVESDRSVTLTLSIGGGAR